MKNQYKIKKEGSHFVTYNKRDKDLWRNEMEFNLDMDKENMKLADSKRNKNDN